MFVAALSPRGLPSNVAFGVYAPNVALASTSSTLPADNSTTVTITVTVPNRDGNAVTGATVVLSQTGTGTFGSVSDLGNGSYAATWKTSQAAAHVISAVVNGIACPNTVTVTSSSVNTTSASHSTLSVSSASATVGGAAITATMTSKDTSDVAVTVGGLTVVFSNTGGTSTGTWSATTDVGNGTYTAQFTATGAGTATTVTATMGGTPVTGGSAPTVTCSASGFTTPDLLNNADFESTFDGFANLFGAGAPSAVSGLTRVTDQAKTGSYSIKHSWTTGTSDDSSHCELDLGSNLTHVWARCWFRLTAEPACGGFKFFRFYRGPVNGRDYVGVQVLNGRFVWVSERANNGDGAIIYANSLPSFNAWHSLEFEYDQVNKLARIWVDETLQTYSIWQDGGNVFGASYGTQLLQWTHTDNVARYGDICQTINGSPGFPRSNTGSVWFDRIAYSTLGRIGP